MMLLRRRLVLYIHTYGGYFAVGYVPKYISIPPLTLT